MITALAWLNSYEITKPLCTRWPYAKLKSNLLKGKAEFLHCTQNEIDQTGVCYRIIMMHKLPKCLLRKCLHTNLGKLIGKNNLQIGNQ